MPFVKGIFTLKWRINLKIIVYLGTITHTHKKHKTQEEQECLKVVKIEKDSSTNHFSIFHLLFSWFGVPHAEACARYRYVYRAFCLYHCVINCQMTHSDSSDFLKTLPCLLLVIKTTTCLRVTFA